MKILFNVFPPANCLLPESGFSVLKSHLNRLNHNCKIIYWNHLLYPLTIEYIKPNAVNDLQGILLPYMHLLFGNNFPIDIAARILESKLSVLYLKPPKFSEDLIETISSEITQRISDHINTNKIDQEYPLIGISYKFNQWIAGIYFCRLIRSLNPKVKFVIGGIPTKEEALAIISLFKNDLDYAMWGEGEYSLEKLAFSLENNMNSIEAIPGLVYQENDRIKATVKRHEYVNIPTPDYDEFFESTNINHNNEPLFIEGARGCKWRKCSFCYLNDGYRFRKRDISDIVNDIRLLSHKYRTSLFSFADNDFLCGDTNRTLELLNSLIEYRTKENPNVEYRMLEVNTTYITAEILQKANLAGVRSIQIGFESLSSSLLTKMKKQSSYIHHLLAIKLAIKYGIEVEGANIIKCLPEKNLEDIMESIDNLHFLRFAFSQGFRLTAFSVNIRKSSKYFQQIENDGLLCRWISGYEEFIPTDIYAYKYHLFEHAPIDIDYHWKYLDSAITFLESNRFVHTLNQIAENSWEYIEHFNENELKRIELNKTEIEILNSCDEKIVNLNPELMNFFEHNPKLIDERLIYVDKNLNCIFSIVNI